MSLITRITTLANSIANDIKDLRLAVQDLADGQLSWNYLSSNWTTAPVQVGTTAAGAVYSYTLSETTRYRLVPSIYAAAQDAFYSNWDGTNLTGFIISRG